MELGMALPSRSPQRILEGGHWAERSRLASYWVFEDPWHYEALSVLGALALTTKSIRLGLGAASIFTRSLPLLAMGASTLTILAKGRIALAIGRGDEGSLRSLGAAHYTSSSSWLKSALEDLRKLLEGREVIVKGGNRTLRLEMPPPSRPRLYLASSSPRAPSIAQECCDGILLNLHSPAGYVKMIRGLLGYGKHLACYLQLWPDEADAERIKRSLAERLSLLPHLQHLLRYAGWGEAKASRLEGLLRSGRLEEAQVLIDDQLLEELILRPTGLWERLKEYERSGLNEVVLIPRSLELARQVLEGYQRS